MKDTSEKETVPGKSADISFKEIILKTKSFLRFLTTKWRTMLLYTVVGAVIGVFYAKSRPITYMASSTFVLDDSHGGMGGQYAGLAAMAGFDLGGGSGAGIFQGDNIIELYKSRVMLEKALLTKANFNGKSELLVERFITSYQMRKRWLEKDNIKSISFDGDPSKFNRKQDSLMTSLVEMFSKSLLSITKPDKKLSIIEVDVKTGDELFSKEFNTTLVQTVNNFYTFTKTKNSLQNVQLLQRQADSVKAVLNSSISGVANALEESPNANPNLLSLRVPSQRKQVDVQANTAIYTEVVRNLQLAKITLRQETPLIQLIDEPILPLPVLKWTILKGVILFSILGFFLSVAVVSVKRVYKSLLA